MQVSLMNKAIWAQSPQHDLAWWSWVSISRTHSPWLQRSCPTRMGKSRTRGCNKTLNWVLPQQTVGLDRGCTWTVGFLARRLVDRDVKVLSSVDDRYSSVTVDAVAPSRMAFGSTCERLACLESSSGPSSSNLHFERAPCAVALMTLGYRCC